MPFTLEIRFEGLFLFVQRRNTDPGLHVLIPKSPHPHLVKVNGKPKTLRVENLYKPGNPAAQPVHIAGAISMKKAADGGVVRKELLQGSVPHGELVGRIRLPFPDQSPDLSKYHVGAKAMRDGHPSESLGDVSGIVTMSFTFSDPVTVANETYSASTSLVISHAPPGAAEREHESDEVMHHASVYLGLVEGGKYKVTEFRTTTPYRPKGPEAVEKSVKFAYIDPVDCTVGTGCPPDELNCPHG